MLFKCICNDKGTYFYLPLQSSFKPCNQNYQTLKTILAFLRDTYPLQVVLTGGDLEIRYHQFLSYQRQVRKLACLILFLTDLKSVFIFLTYQLLLMVKVAAAVGHSILGQVFNSQRSLKELSFFHPVAFKDYCKFCVGPYT